MDSRERVVRALEFKGVDRIPADVLKAAELMKEKLFVNGGGLIGQSEINRDVPFENIQALLEAWK